MNGLPCVEPPRPNWQQLGLTALLVAATLAIAVDRPPRDRAPAFRSSAAAGFLA